MMVRPHRKVVQATDRKAVVRHALDTLGLRGDLYTLTLDGDAGPRQITLCVSEVLDVDLEPRTENVIDDHVKELIDRAGLTGRTLCRRCEAWRRGRDSNPRIR
jgi:hypothetical protein